MQQTLETDAARVRAASLSLYPDLESTAETCVDGFRLVESGEAFTTVRLALFLDTLAYWNLNKDYRSRRGSCLFGCGGDCLLERPDKPTICKHTGEPCDALGKYRQVLEVVSQINAKGTQNVD